METKANAEALADDLNRQCYGFVNSVNNNTGVLTQVNGTVGDLSTTALGAVNTGTIVSGVNAAVAGNVGQGS